ncbi:unnamed protein product [Phytophthora fragariaefolia]|uniref:Unnamed protein product n=1 Tax=Phytophthora fragariaefolia TaxID=1490495 RepID=A0A9W7D018_9STRA|nr:unnamed protein product [Phytophthora fragariaefolia]
MSLAGVELRGPSLSGFRLIVVKHCRTIRIQSPLLSSHLAQTSAFIDDIVFKDYKFIIDDMVQQMYKSIRQYMPAEFQNDTLYAAQPAEQEENARAIKKRRREAKKSSSE